MKIKPADSHAIAFQRAIYFGLGSPAQRLIDRGAAAVYGARRARGER